MGLIIHQEKITEELSGKLIRICPFGAISKKPDMSLEISSACRLCKQCIRISEGAIEYENEKTATVDKKEWKGIVVFADITNDYIHPVVFELIGKAEKLIENCPQPVYILVIGSYSEKTILKLRKYGVSTVYQYEDKSFNDFRVDLYTSIIEDFINRMKPSAVLFGATDKGRMLAPHVAARFHTGLTADCTSLEMNKNSDIIQIRPAFGGNIMAEILTSRTRPQLCTARYKIFDTAPETDSLSEIRKLHMKTTPESLIEIEKIEEKHIETDLSDAEAIIAVGRGLKSKTDISMIEKLASLLSAQVAFSRPLIQAGWAAPLKQNGLSGRTVKPKLLITIGISGAIQFIAGMKNSECIISINNDENAPISAVAHYSIVGDLYKIIPPLSQQLEERRNHTV